MKYKTKIVPQDNGYVGHIYANENIIYTSNVFNDPILVTREISSYIASLAEDVVTPPAARPLPLTQPINKPLIIVPGDLSNVSNKSLPPPPKITQPVYSPPRRCCGRG